MHRLVNFGDTYNSLQRVKYQTGGLGLVNNLLSLVNDNSYTCLQISRIKNNMQRTNSHLHINEKGYHQKEKDGYKPGERDQRISSISSPKAECCLSCKFNLQFLFKKEITVTDHPSQENSVQLSKRENGIQGANKFQTQTQG